MNDLDRLPDMSPSDEPGIPSMPGRVPRSPRVTIPTVMILVGIVLTLVCVFSLFLVYGLASLGTITSDEPGYWSLVLGRMFGAEHGGWLAIPASFGFLLGVTFVMLGLVKRGKRRRGQGLVEK